MGRLLIVSNRLPVGVERREDGFGLVPSVGGLATGLSAFYKSLDTAWVGWCETPAGFSAAEREDVTRRLADEHSAHPLFLSDADVRLYYHGFSNRTIWPMFHQFTQYAVYDHAMWQAYNRVNQRFCDAVISIAQPDDVIWVHDYHLMLLPSMIREKKPDATIGFFLHIPFPSFEVFRQLPWRAQILEGMLGSDLIGFHTYDYVGHFLDSVTRITGCEHLFGQVTLPDSVLKVDAFPMGIDFERFTAAGRSGPVVEEAARIRAESEGRSIILSIDRLDYTKGITQRLEAFDAYLKRHPERCGNVDLILVAVPSRTRVEHYRELKHHVDELIGRINGEHGSMEWTPVRYLYRSLPFNDLVALYAAADVALVTPLRDGMNLIAKEYVATRGEAGGVLILSEMAGAAMELAEAIVVNPNNLDELVDAIEAALEMPQAEQVERDARMQRRLQRYDVSRWAQDFIDQLSEAKRAQRHLNARKLTPKARGVMIEEYRRCTKRLLLLDYDGTLVQFSDRIDTRGPDADLAGLLEGLARDHRNEVVVVSGRDRRHLERWLGKFNVGLVAEHGAWVRERGHDWQVVDQFDDSWKAQVRPVLDHYVDRTPGSFVEEKDFSLAWHYRRTDPALAEVRARELADSLTHLIANQNLGVLTGHKVLEVKNSGVDKGHSAQRWIGRRAWDFILGVGDDRTDEEMFAALPDWASSIKVGLGPSRAKYGLDTVADVRTLLRELVNADA